MAVDFAEISEDFLRFTSEIIWCTVTTVDGDGRPRSRILHPIWELIDGRPVGWIATAPSPIKSRHLAAHPVVAFSYWCPDHHVVQGEAVASWVESLEDKKHVWDLFATTPPPLGYDLKAIGGMAGPEQLTALRLDPDRVQVLDGSQVPENFTPRVAVL
ncbi:pyridoxamine 5'-phosphate oxidase family protein [Nocardia mexicana]|uniref:Pyridoxamine 5'-phosphate oxidase n=1 Tax=Nocardia mexicana TaxID=279262 RepID=A0A370GMW7_9NOCA|nr:pyridoxamine 5'-phosphate oxidase family protein [Nocardia mexicana]RDI44649.1 pyridoxamine 5'-phosphate oxidase [Nocardia mexicana]